MVCRSESLVVSVRNSENLALASEIVLATSPMATPAPTAPAPKPIIAVMLPWTPRANSGSRVLPALSTVSSHGLNPRSCISCTWRVVRRMLSAVCPWPISCICVWSCLSPCDALSTSVTVNLSSSLSGIVFGLSFDLLRHLMRPQDVSLNVRDRHGEEMLGRLVIPSREPIAVEDDAVGGILVNQSSSQEGRKKR